MDTHSLDVLEFHVIQQKLSSYAFTEPGRKLCQSIFPRIDKEWIEEALSEVQQVKEAISLFRRIPLSGMRDITPFFLKMAKEGISLDIHELIEIGKFLDVINDVRQWLSKIGDNYSILKAYQEKIIPIPQLKKKLESTIDPSGEIVNTASPELAKIRKQIRSIKDEIYQILEGFIGESEPLGALQGDFITTRNERYVIPVKTKRKSMVQGIVHDESDSGATLFIEPMTSVESQNRFCRMKIKEDAEIKRIVAELSNLVLEASDSLKSNLDLLAELDFLQAKALFSQALKGISPLLSSEPVVSIKRAWHPLLIFRHLDQADADAGTVPVPIDLKLDNKIKAMVISGPNTGGKTVTLKMAGILQLMVQAGLQIPVEEGSEMGIFEEVLADIGDEQDITQGLSSFSSHIKNLVRIIERVNPQSMCLLDELGSDTNPSEGAALGIAVLEYILRQGAFCLITTHHNALKAYASIHQDQVVNASMGFDPERMLPTYALHTGYPGSSNAFDTCVRLGLPAEILERAKVVLGEGEIKLDNLLYRLNQEETRIREERERQERLSSESELIKNRYTLLKEKIEEREARVAREAQNKVKEIVEKARKEIEGIVQEVKKRPPASREIKMIDHDLKKVTEKLLPPSPMKSVTKKGMDIETISVGQQVLIVDFNEQGIVRQIDRRDKKVWVMTGSLKLQVEANDLAPVDLTIQTTEPKKNIPSVITQLPKEEINPTLMVIGQRAEDALLKIDKYIDNAVLAQLTHVSIIHGKGTGALKEAIEKFLASHPQVAQFRSGGPQEGGTGVTIVDLAV